MPCGSQVAVRNMTSVTAGSILATELEYLSNQQSELPALDHFDCLNEACATSLAGSQLQSFMKPL